MIVNARFYMRQAAFKLYNACTFIIITYKDSSSWNITESFFKLQRIAPYINQCWTPLWTILIMIKSTLWHILSWSEKNSFLLGLKLLKKPFACLFVCFYFFLQNYMSWANFNLTWYKTPLVEGFVGWVIEVLRLNVRISTI